MAQATKAAPTGVVTVFSALGDPIRWRIVQLLSHGERCVCDLESELSLAQSRLSYHLNVLREAGVVVARRDGRWSFYRLDPQACEDLAGALEQVATTWLREGATRQADHC